MFITYSSIEVVPARERRDLIQKLGREKVLTPDLVVPFQPKRDAGGNPTSKKARITAGDLLSRGKVPNTYPANLAGETSRYMTQLELKI